MFRTIVMAGIEVVAGKTTQVTLGESSRVVTLRPRLPQGLNVPANCRFSANIGTCLPEAVQSISKDLVTLRKWFESPDGKAWSSKRQTYDFEMNSDGSYSAEGVPPGTYDLTVSAFDPSTPASRTVASTRIVVTVPVEPAGGTLDLGEVVLVAPAQK